MSTPELDFETRQIHAGARLDSDFGARMTPVYQSAGFVFDSFADGEARFSGESDRGAYARTDNPTNASVARRLADLDGGAGALLTASGTAAIALTLSALASTGDHVLATASLYEGTKTLFARSLSRQGIEVELIPADSPDDVWRRAFRPTTRAVFTETIPNPKNDVVDLARVAAFAHEHGVPLVVDNTVATPYLCRPIEHGADIVIHSTSKWLSGHGAVLGGVVIDSGTFDWQGSASRFPQIALPNDHGVPSFVERYGQFAFLTYLRTVMALDYGPTLPATSAFLLLQGIETLSLRMDRHVSNALEIAQWLEHQEQVATVDYPGLVASPYYARAQKYLPRGQGAVVTFEFAGGRPAAEVFIDSLRLISRMTHLGDVRTLAIHTASTIHGHLTDAERLSRGITQGTVRLSVGLESVRDLRRDLEQAFAAVEAAGFARPVAAV
ncbi:O-acetylhomoserine aminocarboxypropyltransferase/cysteine synthase family protein [Frondihabitans australicus]|uniref:homocysteine desulfhydrase n=1 Tax=Frondihabitans australicus TaxID=386892 RepID=A0A495ICX6_9MICO|nr:PLP-dependent transferase [Frondihabitans australicus]RKR72955.1 O-acetylhomoserine sulfhydrylase [Frondihabitans australicus]